MNRWLGIEEDLKTAGVQEGNRSASGEIQTPYRVFSACSDDDVIR